MMVLVGLACFIVGWLFGFFMASLDVKDKFKR